MIVVIQCAAGKQPHAGHLRTRDGRNVMFVAQPKSAPADGNLVYARPDDISDRGDSWRTVLEQNNTAPGESPESPPDLLPAWQLYKHPTYRLLAKHFGPERLYILSAGWGLVRADFLLPNYDITFSRGSNVPSYKRRSSHDIYRDFPLPAGVDEPIVFFGGRDYIPMFTKLTASATGPRTVFYAGRRPEALGCTLRRFGDPFTNWHYQCAKEFLKQVPESGYG